MNKEINIEDVFLPERNILFSDAEGTLHTTILDQELDCIECTFQNDGGVEIDTTGLTYISLSVGNLRTLINLIKKSEKRYNS